MPNLMIPMPEEMKLAIQEKARRDNFPSTAAAVRKVLCQWLGKEFQVPGPGRPVHENWMSQFKQPDGSWLLPDGVKVRKL